MKVDIVNTTHCLLEAFLCLYIFREFMKMWISRRDYWKEIDSYRNLLIILLVFVTLNKKHLDIGSTDNMATLQVKRAIFERVKGIFCVDPKLLAG